MESEAIRAVTEIISRNNTKRQKGLNNLRNQSENDESNFNKEYDPNEGDGQGDITDLWEIILSAV